MFRDMMIVVVVLLSMIAAVVGVVAGSLHRIARTQQEAGTEAAAAIPTTKPATNPSTESAKADLIVAAREAAIVRRSDPIDLAAADAMLHGNLVLADGPVGRGGKGRNGRWTPEHPLQHISGFRAAQDYAQWTVDVPKYGDYDISLNYACADVQQWRAAEHSHFMIKVAGRELSFVTEGSDHTFRLAPFGHLTLPAGKATVILRAAPEGAEHPFMNLREIELNPRF